MKISLRKMFTPIVLIFTIVIFLLTWWLCRSDKLIVLAVLAIIDFISGLIKAVKNGKIDSRVCFNGICKKFYMFALVLMSYELERTLAIPFFDIFVSFYTANEGLSIIENAGEYIPLPDGVKEKFVQIRSGKNEN